MLLRVVSLFGVTLGLHLRVRARSVLIASSCAWARRSSLAADDPDAAHHHRFTCRIGLTSVFRDVEELHRDSQGLVSSGAPRYFLVFSALSIFGWVGMARLVRSQVLVPTRVGLRARRPRLGRFHTRILFRHLLPNITNLIIVVVTISLGAAAAAEIGSHIPRYRCPGSAPELRRDDLRLRPGPDEHSGSPHAHPLSGASSSAPSLLSFNLLGDVLTDIMSPRRR